MRKRRIKKAGKKLDAEVKAIVWPELFKRPTVRITARERKAAKNVISKRSTGGQGRSRSFYALPGKRMSFFAGYPVARFKQARKEFIQVAGIADFDPKAKARATELREEMHRASQEIALRTRRASDRRARGHRSSGQKLRPPGR